MSETDWYLIDRGGRRYGPYDREFVERLAAQRELRPRTPVWHPGLARWQPAERVLKLPPGAEPAAVPAGKPAPVPAPVARASARGPAKAPVATPVRPRVAAPPSPRPAPTARAQSPTPPITPPQIAQRVLAAASDALCLYLAWRLLRVGVPALQAQLPLGTLSVLAIAWALLDAVLVSRVGTTPGKALFGVSLRGPENQKLDFARAIAHSAALPALLLLTTLKVGLLTFLAIAGLLIAAGRLRAGKSPWWDDLASVRVNYAELPPARRSLGILAFVVALVAALFVAGVTA